MAEVRIPRLGIGMTEGTLIEWLVADGEHVEVGTPLYLLETDKVENEIESAAAGRISIVGEPATTYPVGDVVATVE